MSVFTKLASLGIMAAPLGFIFTIGGLSELVSSMDASGAAASDMVMLGTGLIGFGFISMMVGALSLVVTVYGFMRVRGKMAENHEAYIRDVAES